MPNDNEALQRLLQAETKEGSAYLPWAGSPIVLGLTVLYHPDAGADRRASGARRPQLRAEGAPVPPRARLFSAGTEPPATLGRSLPEPPSLRFVPGSEPGSVGLLRGESRTAVVVDGKEVSDEHAFSAGPAGARSVLLLAEPGGPAALPDRPVDRAGAPGFGLVGESAPALALRREIQRVADLDVPVLLRGETGTGKELVARAIHEAGPRRAPAVPAVNMGAVPPTLAASELFGAARGAYTGADQRGRTATSSAPTAAPCSSTRSARRRPRCRSMLLRALETGEIQPVGGEAPRGSTCA